MSTIDPKTHLQKPRNLAAGFALSYIIKSEPYVDNAIRLLKKRFVEFSERKSEIHLDHWFNTWHLTSWARFSSLKHLVFWKLETTSVDQSPIQRHPLYTLLAGFLQSFHRLTRGNPIISDRKLMPAQHIFDTALHVIDSRQKDPEARKGILSLGMKQRIEHPDKFSEQELYNCVNMTVGAGADTVSASLQSFIYHLIRSPQHLVKLD